MGTITDNPKRMGDILDGNSGHPKVGIRRARPRILFLLRRYVDPYTDSAIARIDSHSPDESAKAGRTIFMGSPKSFSASAASVALISCRREGTSAGLDWVGT